MPARRRVVVLQHAKFARVETETRHAGVDMQHRRQFAPCRQRGLGPRVELRQRAQHRYDVVCQIVALRCRESGRPARRAAHPARVRGSRAPRPAGRRRSAGSRRRAAPARRDARQGRSRRPSPRRRRGRWDAVPRSRCQLATIAPRSMSRIAAAGDPWFIDRNGHGRRSRAAVRPLVAQQASRTKVTPAVHRVSADGEALRAALVAISVKLRAHLV